MPLREQCTRTIDPDRARSIIIHPEPVHRARMSAHHAQQEDGWAKVYRLRAGIESTISQAVRGPDLRHCLYRGLAKAHVQNVLTGIALNFTRLGTRLESADQDKPQRQRPPTRVYRLCVTRGITTP